MIDPRTEELLHGEMDGQATKEQLAELHSRLASSSEGQTYREDLREMQQVLHSIKDVEPPADLKQQIIAKVAVAQPPWSLDETRNRAARNLPNAPRGRNLAQRFLDSLREGLRPREAFAFGLGAAACLVIVFLAGWDRFESIGFPDNALPGSMIPFDTSTLQPIDRNAVEGEGMQVIAELGRSGSLVHVALQVDSGPGMVIEAFFDPQTLTARGVSQAGDSALWAANILDGSVRIQHDGSALYSIRFEERQAHASVVRIQMRYEGETQEITLRTGK